MKIQYFPETDTLSIRINDQPSTESSEIAPDSLKGRCTTIQANTT